MDWKDVSVPMPYDSLSQQGDSVLNIYSRSTSWFIRNLASLTAAMLFAVLIPFVFRYGVNNAVRMWDQTPTSLFVMLAVSVSHILIGKLSRYPGEDPLSSILPGVLGGFSVAFAIIMAGHFSYSRSLLFSGFVGALMWYGIDRVLTTRIRKPRLAVVPLGNAQDLEQLPNADWLRLSSPPTPFAPHMIDGVVADLSADLTKEWSAFIVSSATGGIAVYDWQRTRELMTGRVDLSHAGNIGLNALLPQRGYLAIKSLIDVLAATLLLPIVLVAIGLSAIAIKLESKGPVFFIQKRVGYRGRQFYCYKLRSMHIGADTAGPSFTAQGDSRITTVGRIIRKYRIDELPQILNILKGEMSWIGPRPEALSLAMEYERHIPFYGFRHAVKPGITGWAAVRQGNVGNVEAATVKLQHDFFYIKNISPSLDAFIAAKTIWIILTGFGSR